MDPLLALPLLVALVAALLYVRHAWRRQQQRAHALRRSGRHAPQAEQFSQSARSEMRYGEDSLALVDDMTTRPHTPAHPPTPSVGK